MLCDKIAQKRRAMIHADIAAGTVVPAKKHYAWLDWLRFGAALAVVVCHVRGGHWVDWGSLEESSKGAPEAVFFALTRPNFEPVVVFFVLSGFLVGGRLIARMIAGSFNPKSYVLDRVSRIYLPLVPAVFLSALVAWWIGSPATLQVIGGNLFSLQGVAVPPMPSNSPLWSLSYEVWFYIIAGALASCFVTRNGTRIFAFSCLTIALLVYSNLQVELLFCWLLGAAAYPLRETAIRRWSLIMAFAAFILGLAASQSAMVSSSAILPDLSLPDRYISAMVMSAGLAVLVAWLSSLTVRTELGRRIQAVGTYLAGFSYTLYLSHYPVLTLMHYYSPNKFTAVDGWSLLLFLMKIVVCLVVAWLMFLPFEAHTSEFRRWLSSTFNSSRRLPAGAA